MTEDTKPRFEATTEATTEATKLRFYDFRIGATTEATILRF